MGIRGLHTFMKLNGCCEPVKLADIADAYRNETGKEPVLLIDFSSCVSFFYTSSPGIKTVSGELKKFLENLKTFLNNCEELGIQMKVFGDGKRPTYKYRIWVENIARKVEDLKGIYSGQTNTCSESWRGALFWIATDYFLSKGKFTRAIHEADDGIFKYLKVEDCFGVLTNDSDFLMMDNFHYCLSPDNLNVQSMTFFNFNRSSLAKLLKINASQLPLFASLCVSQFQCSDLQEIYKHEKINGQDRFFGVAELIKNFNSKEELVRYIFSLMESMEITFLERRLKFYLHEDEEDMRRTARNHWGEILQFAEERHTTGEAHSEILSIIQDRVKFIGPTCENIFMSSPECALLTIRKKIYGILFFEHPDSLIFITEFSYEYLRKGLILKPYGRTVIVDRRPHSGLLKLWSLENTESLRRSRRAIFCEAINDKLTAEDFSRLNIPVEYVIPILAAFYLLWEFDKFKEFEVETILIQAILVKRLTDEQIDQLPEEFYVEALDLTGWFFFVGDCLRLLNSVCGEPFCKHKTNLGNFFDGKVLHYVYGKMKKGESPWTSFSEYEKEYETLHSELYELGRICGHVEPREK